MDPDKPEPDEDPILAMLGIGKEVWRELGGGEDFIRELRDGWGDWPNASEENSNDSNPV